MRKAKIQKNGNRSALPIPQAPAPAPELSLPDLLKRVTQKNRHPEIHTGPNQGAEISEWSPEAQQE